MFTIGEFARFGSVTVRTLRHYDQIGLLNPERIDESNGYRLYAASQLTILNRIVALQRLGFSLDEIGEMLGSTTAEQLRGMLLLRKSQVEEELALQQSALAEIEMRLRAIEKEGAMPDLDITIKRLPRQRFAAMNAVVPGFGPANTADILIPLAGELQQILADQGIKPIGYWFICFDRTPADEILAYFCLPIDESVESLPEPAGIYEFEPVDEAISLVRETELADGYNDVYQDLLRYAETNNYRLAGDGRDISLDGNGEGTGTVMEIQWPVYRDGEAPPTIAPQPIA